MKKISEKQRQLFNEIDRIIWEDWDPIGVNDYGEDCRDEYESYIPHLFSLVEQGADYKKIAKHLSDLEKNTMGMLGSYEHCEEVAKKLIEAKNIINR